MITDEEEKTVRNPVVISEEIEYTGRHCDFLVYEIEAEENGKKSVFFATDDVTCNMDFVFRRASILDPAAEDGSEEWCRVPKELLFSDEFAEIRNELRARTSQFWDGCYKQKYPKRTSVFTPNMCYKGMYGKIYRYVFSVLKEGEYHLYGCPVNRRTGECDDSKVEQIPLKDNWEPPANIKYVDGPFGIFVGIL